MNNYKFIDLFAGIGGIRLPFDKLGCKCVFSSEIDKFAIETYKANFNETPSGDITKIKAEDIPQFDILLAGFPCQAFSIAGKRKGFGDIRGTMFFEIKRILEYHKPQCFLLENVKGLTNHDNGNTFKTILNILKNDLNYNVFYKILNAKNYGLPQNRERIIIVGFLNHNIKFEFPKPTKEKTCLGDILESKVDSKYTISDRLWASHQRRKELNKKKGNGFGYCLFDKKSEYTSTISARYYKDGSEILIKQKGKNPRKLTPREAARLQGFPDNFKLVCSDTQCYKQFGNSVPTKMIEKVAQEILKSLGENTMKTDNKEKLKLDSKKYNNNLDFYTILKLLIQCQFTEKQLLLIQKSINANLEKIQKDVSLLKLLILENSSIIKHNNNKYEKASYFFSTVKTMDCEMWCNFTDLAIDLLVVKDLILQESKTYATTEYRKELNRIRDELSIEYDLSGLHLPYGQRVVSSLLVFMLTDMERETCFLLEKSDKIVDNFACKIKNISKKYNLNVNSMYQIIIDESINQSIKSDAGSNYESRARNMLVSIVEDLKGHSHDSKIPSVEYDNTFRYNNRFCGISIKRTLRERYKQNLENVENLDVDYLFVITLGTDLNEEKLNNILQKNGVYVIVSQEEYNARDFLNKNPRVVSSSTIEKSFNEIIK